MWSLVCARHTQTHTHTDTHRHTQTHTHTHTYYVLYDLLWEYEQGHYHSKSFLLYYYYVTHSYCMYTHISSRFGHGGATSSQLHLVVIPS